MKKGKREGSDSDRHLQPGPARVPRNHGGHRGLSVIDQADRVSARLQRQILWADTDTAVMMEEKIDHRWMADWTVTRMYEEGHSNHPSDLDLEWTLPNEVRFGASVKPGRADVELGLWLENGLDEPLLGLRTQLCVMLRGAPDFNAQTRDNKIFEEPAAAVQSASGDRWILTAWERTGRSWGNPRCPCMHADPVFPDCEPGRTVRLAGRLWFAEGSLAEVLGHASKGILR